jgi:hypothetical protein
MKEATTKLEDFQDLVLRQRCNNLLEELEGNALEEAYKGLQECVAFEKERKSLSAPLVTREASMQAVMGETADRPAFHFDQEREIPFFASGTPAVPIPVEWGATHILYFQED